MNNERYHDMLKAEIQEFVNMFSCRTLEDMIVRVGELELDLELLRKRKSIQGNTSEGETKKPKTFDSQSRSQYGWCHFGKCGKMHNGVCRMASSGCYKCGKTDHFNMD